MNSFPEEDPQDKPAAQDAPLCLRFPAFFLDTLPFFMMTQMFPLSSRPGINEGFIWIHCIGLASLKFFEAAFIACTGFSLGRWLFKVKLVDSQGRKPNFIAAFIYLMLECCISYPLIFPAFRMLWDREKGMWHDRMMKIRALNTGASLPADAFAPLPRLLSIGAFALVVGIVCFACLALFSLPCPGPLIIFSSEILERSSYQSFFSQISYVLAIAPSRTLWILYATVILSLVGVHFALNLRGKICITERSPSPHLTEAVNSVLTQQENMHRESKAFYWATGAATMILIYAAAYFTALHSNAFFLASHYRQAGLRFLCGQVKEPPLKDISAWNKFLKAHDMWLRDGEQKKTPPSPREDDLVNIPEQWRRDAREREARGGRLWQKWKPYMDIDIRRFIGDGGSFRAGSPPASEYRKWSDLKDRKIIVIKGKGERAEAFMEVKTDGISMVIEDLDIAPWNYSMCGDKNFNDILLFECLSAASRLSREWKMKGSFSISRALLQKARSKENQGPDEMITLKGWILEAFTYPGGGRR
ncbi:MAG: RDD family protein [Candidatus Eremiobacteraeota bacterium]|nr:RDD family protein [Candidatus Eremiobacteraeota bacterium]